MKSIRSLLLAAATGWALRRFRCDETLTVGTLTAVGKVFKPQLRWDATRRVFTQTLSPLADEGVALTVSVGAHGTHGSLATVTVSGVPAAQRADIEQRIHQLLNPFVIRHDIAWQ